MADETTSRQDIMADHGSALRRTLSEVALYPPHAPRQATALYHLNHHKIVVEEDRPCLVCGVRNSTLGDPAHNVRGSKAIETHHRVIEDALANAIDLSKFNRRVLPGLLAHTGHREKYGHDFTQAEMLEWIHGDYDHLWPLCDVCHRHPFVGIHAVTFPVWTAQDLIMDGYNLTGFTAASPAEAHQLTALPQTTGTAQAPGHPA